MFQKSQKAPIDKGILNLFAGHGGCGELQPKIHREHGTFKLWAEFKQTNIDERSSERKELVTAQQVFQRVVSSNAMTSNQLF